MSFSALATSLGSLTTSLNSTTAAVGAMTTAVSSGVSSMQSASQAAKELTGDLEEVSEKADETTKLGEDLQKEFDKILAKNATMTGFFSNFTEAFRSGQLSAEEFSKQLEMMKDKLQALGGLYSAYGLQGFGNVQDVISMLEALAREIEKNKGL